MRLPQARLINASQAGALTRIRQYISEIARRYPMSRRAVYWPLALVAIGLSMVLPTIFLQHDDSLGMLLFVPGALGVLVQALELPRRKDLRPFEKVFWLLILPMPYIGLIVYCTVYPAPPSR